VDDGSDVASQVVLESLEKQGLKVLYRPQNGGKGAAVKSGVQYAKQHGYSHVLQVDADAQHCLADTEKLVAMMQQYPKAVICAEPIYGDDAPKSRLYGRKITTFWLAINTLSLTFKDGMCGFRIYPVEITSEVFAHDYVGNYMEFDIELLVRLHRRSCEFHWVKTPVRYENNGVSHFRAFHDNARISWMHTRLFFDMLWHFPQLIHQKWRGKQHGQ
jgi:glycosyltransferase involved in cell wall biosynthesis